MFYILVAFFSPIFGALTNTIESKLSNNIFKHQTTMIFYISLMNWVFLPLCLFFGTPSIPSQKAMLCYLGVAMVDIIYLYPFYTAMKVIDNSIVAALFSLGQITIPLMSFLFLGEILNLEQYIGFTIIIMSSVALSIKGTRIPKLSKAFYYMVFASLLRSGYIILEKYTLIEDENWINMVIYPSILSGILPLSFLFVRKWRKDIIKNFPPYYNKFKIFAINEFICYLELVTEIYGISGLSPVVSAAISATLPMFMLGFCYIGLKKFNIPLNEKITRQQLIKKIFCFVLILLGVVLVVPSSSGL
ncbi:MAG: EamA family transporter [Alphaproteobacteria bacterium]|nr:EamA family transporter [Alphaproteobacteria bacterium]